MPFNQGITFNARDQNINNLLPIELELIDNPRVKFPLHVGQWIVNNNNNFFGLGKETIRLLFNDI